MTLEQYNNEVYRAQDLRERIELECKLTIFSELWAWLTCRETRAMYVYHAKVRRLWAEYERTNPRKDLIETVDKPIPAGFRCSVCGCSVPIQITGTSLSVLPNCDSKKTGA